MRFVLFITLTLGVIFSLQAQQTEQVETLRSPDGNYELRLLHAAQGQPQSLSYSLTYKGQTVIEKSALSIQLDNHLSEWALAIKKHPGKDWMRELKLIGQERRSVEDAWEPPFGECARIPEVYNELVLTFEQAASDNYRMDVQLRAYNEGVALRYYFHENPTGIYYRVVDEHTRFTFPEGTQAWFEPWAQGPFSLLPLADWPTESERPLTLELPNGLYACLAEAAMVDYVRTKFELDPDLPNTVRTVMYEPVDKITYFTTPWRVIMAAEEAGELIENNHLLLNLNDPNRIENTDWIKPGKIVRDLTLTEEGAKSWIDFAAEHNLQYVLFDWLWYGPAFTWDSDAGTVDTNKMKMNLQEIIDYGKAHDVGIFVYVNQQALARQDFDIFPLYKEWGLAGVKYGFVQVGSHRWTKWIHESIERAAENELMVNIHDEFRTTGEQRTWPNIVTVEGIRGNEEMPEATHNTILPFTRGVAGLGDYTICYYDPRIKTTHAHQLALAVVMYSPLQTMYWYDSADKYQGEPEIEFFDEVPTVWDDTRVLSGRPGEHVAMARRSGEEWFVGAITNNDARNLDIKLDFLDPDKQYVATLYEDDEKVQTQTQVALNTRTVDHQTELSIALKASGGVAIWIREK